MTEAGFGRFVMDVSPFAPLGMVAILEGGYTAASVAAGTTAVLRAMLGSPEHPVVPDQHEQPRESTAKVIRRVMKAHSSFWQCCSVDEMDVDTDSVEGLQQLLDNQTEHNQAALRDGSEVAAAVDSGRQQLMQLQQQLDEVGQ